MSEAASTSAGTKAFVAGPKRAGNEQDTRFVQLGGGAAAVVADIPFAARLRAEASEYFVGESPDGPLRLLETASFDDAVARAKEWARREAGMEAAVCMRTARQEWDLCADDGNGGTVLAAYGIEQSDPPVPPCAAEEQEHEWLNEDAEWASCGGSRDGVSSVRRCGHCGAVRVVVSNARDGYGGVYDITSYRKEGAEAEELG